ncbi:MAG TPA: peptide ABC transporter substrate-binding protein [Candidatus Saccharimonadales bacterium]|nr:peptide ABC transporter substrate-binding protein [Candidatus Saccharimonadales bacterium]
MVAKTLKMRVRRRFRKGRRQVEGLGHQAEDHIDQHFVKRLARLIEVRRFVIVWVLLLVLLGGVVVAQTDALSSYYQTIQPVPGGIYTEGILGDFTTANPLYATSPVDNSVAHLVFASLLTYNNNNQLVGDLASSWSADATAKVYTVNLKPNLTWQDGQPLTAADVAFTYHLIQNPSALSPLNASWQDIKVTATNRLTVTFTLSNPLASFPDSLTNGIVPEHLLANIPVATLRSANFNIDPVGAGPFSWQSLAVNGNTPQTRQEQINLMPFAAYNGGQPKLSQIIIRAFHNQAQLISSFKSGDLNGVAGLDNVPATLVDDKHLNQYSLPLTAANMVFFKTTAGVLGDVNVRKALVQATNTTQIIQDLGYPVSPVHEPLLNGQLGFSAQYEQQTGDPVGAAMALQQAGWVLGKSGIRYKGGQPLTFTLYAPDTQDNNSVTKDLQTQWRSIGVNMRVVLQGPIDIQNTIAFHAYDALLYGISIGTDPDVFAYWDSSQANPSSLTHSNFSEYQSPAADEGLEAGRTVSDPALRAIKYQSFLQAWYDDAPALGLYQPRFLYLTYQPVYGLDEHTINQATDRFNNVQNWEIRQDKVTD